MEVYILKKIIKYNTINYSQYCLLVLTCNITLTERPDNHSLFFNIISTQGYNPNFICSTGLSLIAAVH